MLVLVLAHLVESSEIDGAAKPHSREPRTLILFPGWTARPARVCDEMRGGSALRIELANMQAVWGGLIAAVTLWGRAYDWVLGDFDGVYVTVCVDPWFSGTSGGGGDSITCSGFAVWRIPRDESFFLTFLGVEFFSCNLQLYGFVKPGYWQWLQICG